jgi:hypothetical protein
VSARAAGDAAVPVLNVLTLGKIYKTKVHPLQLFFYRINGD